jgi:hypothetical protein
MCNYVLSLTIISAIGGIKMVLLLAFLPCINLGKRSRTYPLTVFTPTIVDTMSGIRQDISAETLQQWSDHKCFEHG